MTYRTAAILVIGDEILSGRTRDANMYHLAKELNIIGIDLKQARFVADEMEAIASSAKELSSIYDYVFSSGGIGPTHDDITADAIASAFGLSIDIRNDAVEILKAYYDRQGLELNSARLRMARVPEGATLIDNAISSAPGFRIRNIYVMAGVPSIFCAMLESILPTLKGGLPMFSESIQINRGEGDIAAELGQTADAFPEVFMGSYPFQKDGKYGTNLVLRSRNKSLLKKARARLMELIQS